MLVNFLRNVVSLRALTIPFIHPQEEYVFSQQLLRIQKAGFWFCFYFLLPLASVEFMASERTKSVVNGSQGSHSCGHAAVIMNFDLDLQFEQSPWMRVREFSYARKCHMISSCSRLRTPAWGPACLSHWPFSRGNEQEVPGVWTSFPTIFGHP